ncbi:hypothetical protein PIB30_055785 [Stylosanthes scabra]|uniref:Uncharacterized protein n=1 Tax=Stylosanthes scabra TaxID=79078 RepID=A0ABU6ZHV4_9FABA|nr:hypothetical protein [Stylosanthes scabra]
MEGTLANPIFLMREETHPTTFMSLGRFGGRGHQSLRKQIIHTWQWEMTHHWQTDTSSKPPSGNRLQGCICMFSLLVGDRLGYLEWSGGAMFKFKKVGTGEDKMVKKTATEKQKKKKTDVQYDKTHRTRCSPSEVAKTYKDLGDQKRALVHEMGFGVLVENMSNYNFSNLIMMELVDSFHIPDSTIRTNVGKFKIDATKVGHAFGLNAQGRLYRHKVIKKQVTAAQYEVVESFRKKTLADLRDMVYTIPLDSEENITKFKRAFILYVQ